MWLAIVAIICLIFILVLALTLPQSYQTRFPSIAAPHDACVQRENAGFLAPLQTKITCSGKISIASGTPTVGLPVPPTGKIWCITDIDLSHDSTVAVEFKIVANGVTIFDWPVKGDTAPFIGHNLETQLVIPPNSTPQLITGTNAATNAYFYITGVQQDIGNG